MSRQISVDEVKKHADEKSAWIIIRNDVYDVTPFLNEHPGGRDPLLNYAGKDGTEAFDSVPHSDGAKIYRRTLGFSCCGHHHNTATCLNSGFVPCPKSVIVLPVQSDECCEPTPPRPNRNKKTWRTFDRGCARVEGSASADGARSVDGSRSRSRSLASTRSIGVGSQSAFSRGYGTGSVAGRTSAAEPRGGGATRTKSKDGLAASGAQGGKGRDHSHGPLGFLKGPCQHCIHDPKTLRTPQEPIKTIIKPRDSGFIPYPTDVTVLPITSFSNECCQPNPKRVPKKTWRTFDGGTSRVEGSTSIEGATSRSVGGSQSFGSARSVGIGSQSAYSGGSRSAHGGYGHGGYGSAAEGGGSFGGSRSFGGSGSFGGGGARGTKSKDDMAPSGGRGGRGRHSHGPLGFMKGPCQHCTNDPKTRGPRPEDHVKSIIVPKERGKLKWALMFLGVALVVAMAVKKMKG